MNSLGIKFGIPEYNSSLHDRMLQSSRPVTSALPTSEPQRLAMRPVTHSVTSRPYPSNLPVTRDSHMPSRGIVGLQRSYTFAPKLSTDPISKPDDRDHQRKAAPKEAVMTFEKQKTRLSLPPIYLDMKSRSLTISHF